MPVRLNRQEKINSYLFKKYSPDFFTNLFAIPDIVHHLFWKYMDSSHPHYREKESRRYLPLIEDCYQTLDDIIGKRLKMIDEDTVVIIMSDHGGGPLHRFIQLNRWLEKCGLLALKNKHKGGSLSFARKLMKRLLHYAPQSAIDWSQPKAFAGRSSEHGIYCNLKGREKDGIVNPEDYEELRRTIIAQLSEITDPYTGQKIFEKIYRREDVYSGPYVSYAPDIVLGFGNNPYEPGDALSGGEIIENVKSDGFSGMHRPDGILIAYGNNVKKGSALHGAAICDLAPTILYAMGLKIPSDMDGKVLYDIFEPSFTDKHPAEYDKTAAGKAEPDEKELNYTGNDTEEIAKRLKSLGYI
ncbi:MAG: alkaline phosphatase family protein [Nitrospirae bacterium]|nr:alkaline phosphatase family protein [Nitrospirota bacterium]